MNDANDRKMLSKSALSVLTREPAAVPPADASGEQRDRTKDCAPAVACIAEPGVRQITPPSNELLLLCAACDSGLVVEYLCANCGLRHDERGMTQEAYDRGVGSVASAVRVDDVVPSLREVLADMRRDRSLCPSCGRSRGQAFAETMTIVGPRALPHLCRPDCATCRGYGGSVPTAEPLEDADLARDAREEEGEPVPDDWTGEQIHYALVTVLCVTHAAAFVLGALCAWLSR